MADPNNAGRKRRKMCDGTAQRIIIGHVVEALPDQGFQDLPLQVVLRFLRPKDRWNMSATCRVALQEVEAYSERVFEAIKGPNRCNVDDGFEDRIRNGDDFFSGNTSESVAVATDRDISFRYMVERASKVRTWEVEFGWVHGQALSPSQEKIALGYWDDEIYVFDCSERTDVATLLLENVRDKLHDQHGGKGFDFMEDHDFHGPKDPFPKFHFLDDTRIVVYNTSWTFVWDFTVDKLEQSVRFIQFFESWYSDPVPPTKCLCKRGDEFIFACVEGYSLELKSFNLRELRPSKLFTLIDDTVNVEFPPEELEIVGVAHEKFLVLSVVTCFDNSILVFDLESGKKLVEESKRCSTKLKQMDTDHSKFYVLEEPNGKTEFKNAEIWSVDSESGKFCQSHLFKVKNSSFIYDSITGTTKTQLFRENGPDAEVYDLPRHLGSHNKKDQKDEKTIDPVCLLRGFSSVLVSTKRNEVFLSKWSLDAYEIGVKLSSEPIV